jgi:hypothetical protein
MPVARLSRDFKWVPAGLLALGLLLTAVGAGIAASAVILTEKHATELATAKWDLNVELRDALLDQRYRLGPCPVPSAQWQLGRPQRL